MNTQRPTPLTEQEETELEKSLTITFEAFRDMIGPNVEFIDTYTHYGVEYDGEAKDVQECQKAASVYGLAGTGANGIKKMMLPKGAPIKYQKFFFWHGNALYSADLLNELFDLLALYFRQHDFYAFREADDSAAYRARKAKETAEKEQTELMTVVKEAERLGLCKATAKGKKAA